MYYKHEDTNKYSLTDMNHLNSVDFSMRVIELRVNFELI